MSDIKNGGRETGSVYYVFQFVYQRHFKKVTVAIYSAFRNTVRCNRKSDIQNGGREARVSLYPSLQTGIYSKLTKNTLTRSRSTKAAMHFSTLFDSTESRLFKMNHKKNTRRISFFNYILRYCLYDYLLVSRYLRLLARVLYCLRSIKLLQSA